MNAIDVRNLTKIYKGNIKAVDNLSFEVAEGSIFGFLGPNGAGKSTIIKILITLARPTQGTAHIFDLDVNKEPSKVRGVIGYVPQELSADGALTGYENLLLSAKLYEIPPKERRIRIDAILALLDLTPRAHSLVDTYSGGMVQTLGDWTSDAASSPGAFFRRTNDWIRPCWTKISLGPYTKTQPRRTHDDIPDHSLYGGSRGTV